MLAPLIDDHRADPLMAAARAAGWWWPMAGAVIITDRPKVLRRDAQHRLHCADGPALSYRDGWGVYAWHGIRVPERIIMGAVDIQTIHAETNGEFRRILIERYGMVAYLRNSGAEPVSRAIDEGGEPMELYHLPAGIARLRLRNSTADPDGSRREYVLRVPGTIRDVWEARNWTYDLPRDARFSAVS